MRERVERLVRQYTDARRRRLRFEALMTALSVLVTGGVFWQLRRNGTAISDETAVPAAELAEAGEPVVETDADPPDETARSGIAEEPEDWESALPVFTDESPQQRIAAIAASQLGYTEGSAEVLLSDDGTSRAGYTRYGAWYGNPYGEWNTMFTYFCMYYAGIEKTEIPYGSGCWAWYETLTEQDMIKPCGEEQAGDIVFFDTDADGEPDRTGIVTGTEETEEGTELKVIEGNCEGSVAEKQYLRGGSEMLGVLSADVYVTDLPEGVMLIDYSGDTESGIHVAAQAAAGVFPEGTVMKVRDAQLEEVWGDAALIGPAEMMLDQKVAVDISFYDPDGNEIEPSDSQRVQVQISLPEERKLAEQPEKEPALLHIQDDGVPTIIEDATVTEKSAAFEAESFSIYVVTALGEREKDHIHETLEGGFKENREYDPYIIYVGETITVVGYSSKGGWLSGQDNSILNQLTDTMNSSTDANGVTRRESTYQGVSAGKTRIQINTEGDTKVDFWVEVRDNPYVPHSEEMESKTITIKVGDSLTIYEYVSPEQYEEKGGDFCWRGGDDIFCSPSYKGPEVMEDGRLMISKTYIATATGTSVFYDRNSGKQLTVNVEGTNNIRFFDHSDIEISDDGKYIEVETIENKDGTSVTTKTVYRSAVSSVNTCKVFDIYENTVKTYTSDLYESHGNPGEAQYELTSKYSYFWGYSDNDPDRRNKKLINQASVDHVRFDVNLLLIPQEVITMTYRDGVLISETTRSTLGEDNKTVEHAIFNLDHRAVVDAHNKCPDHSGMDFTISANMATVQLNAAKVLYDINGNKQQTMEAGKFTFRLIENSGGSFTAQTISSSEDVITLSESSDVVNEVYQAFSGTPEAIEWGSGVDGTAVLKELQALSFVGENIFALCTNAQDVYNALMSSTNPQDASRFRKAASENLIAENAMKPATRFEHTLSAEPGYYLVRDVNELIETQTNDENGDVSFGKIIYNKPGKYHYLVFEDIANGQVILDDRMQYDTGVIEVEVEIVEEADRSLTPYVRILNRDKLEFVNREFRLPNTGGTGTLPFMAGGMILISAAFVLPLIRRRKEDEFDS